jgi:hypothetical protein
VIRLAGALAIATAAACFDARAHGGFTPREEALLAGIFAAVCGSALLAFLAPLVLGRGSVASRIGLGLAMGVAAVATFFLTLQGFESHYMATHTTTYSSMPLVVSIAAPFLVPAIYALFAWRRRVRESAE